MNLIFWKSLLCMNSSKSREQTEPAKLDDTVQV